MQLPELSAVKANLTGRLHASDQLLSSVTEERDNLTEERDNLTEERDNLTARLQASDQLIHQLKANRTKRTREVYMLQGHYSEDVAAAHLSAVKANLTECLQDRDQQLSSMAEERDTLNANLTEKTREVDRLQTLSKQNQDSVLLLTEERDRLKVSLSEKTKDRLQGLVEKDGISRHRLTEFVYPFR
ncbi:hypothetical protein JOQ06_022287 [Pogonophryne albipinna]|uniref:Uncharacterized protein n=1 Tax=Pogonophryne albipinna TaxID=1090488 RepID=A0AAD6ABA8_9TELE|nr:hypothetical protein JOQ06_022287 [Pogonophryne albipinna]